MDVTIQHHPRILRSIRNEASRQADFFSQRDPEVSQWWTNVETAAHLALAQKCGLRLVLVPNANKDTILNPCE